MLLALISTDAPSSCESEITTETMSSATWLTVPTLSDSITLSMPPALPAEMVSAPAASAALLAPMFEPVMVTLVVRFSSTVLLTSRKPGMAPSEPAPPR